MAKLVMKGGKGVNKDLLPTELELGYWSDANNFRFRNGFDEKMGGIAEIMATPSITSYALFPYQTTSARYVVEAGIAKAYAHNGTSRTEITRGVAAVAVSSLVDSTPGTTRLLTTSTDHNLTTGDVVTVYGCTGATADDYNAENVAVNVASPTTFSYSGGGANSPAASAGAPAYVVISSSGGVLDFTGGIDDKWTGGHLAGQLILNNPVDGLLYWSGDTATDLRLFTFTTYIADVGRPFQEWFIQLAPTMSSVKYPRRVLWSDGVEPGALPTTFTAATTNDAGNKDLDDSNGFLVDCMGWQGVNWIYATDERYAMRWIGGNSVFDFEAVGDRSGLLARNCIANTPKGQVFITPDGDVRIHTGGLSESLSQGKILNYLSGDWDATYKTRTVLAANPYTKEVWVFYPRSGSQTLNGAIVWNWHDNTWAVSHRSLNITAAATGLLPTSIATTERMIVGTNTPKLGLVDSGTTDFGSTITATLERTGIHGEESAIKKTLHTSRVRADATAANTASMYHGYHIAPDAAASYGSAVTYTQGTTRDVNWTGISAEHMAWKLSTTANDWKQRQVEIEFNVDGEF